MIRKRFLVLFITVFLASFLAAAIPRQSYAQEQIINYDVNIKIHKTSEVDFIEKIQYDFRTENRHGIYRNIPYVTRNSDGIPFQLEIAVTDVKIQDNKNNINSVPYTKSTSGEYLNIKIGDPNKTTKGINTYIISYKVKGAINYFSDHDELYWNATGNEWQRPIQQAKVTIDLSELDYPQITNSNVACYSGIKGSTATNCKIITSPNHAIISSASTLNPYEGLTFVISLPKGMVDFYQIQEAKDTSGETSWIFIVIVVVVFLLNLVLPIAIFLYWYFHGRDPKDDRLLVRMYDPPHDSNKKEMTLMETGTIVDETVNPRDISAEIIGLAINKYITIQEDESKLLGIVKTTKITFERGPKLIENPKM